MSEAGKFDAGVVGAGILGLAHAYRLALKGLKVVVFERRSRPEGASIRNNGMIWPIGQASGKKYALALRSRNLWCELLKESGIWHEETGSLHLAYHQDEAQVLQEFASSLASSGVEKELLTSAEVAKRSQAAKQKGLLAGLWSPAEICVDPREVLSKLPIWLTQKFGIQFVYETTVTGYVQPVLAGGGKSWRIPRLFVCCGDSYEALFPRVFEGEGILRCKSQMMRTTPYPADWKLRPMLAGGLALTDSKSFEPCLSLPTLKKRFSDTAPLLQKFGVNATVSQNGVGELIIGQSHEYGAEIEPFDKHEIDMLIINTLIGFLEVPSIRIAAKWSRITTLHPSRDYSVVSPAPGATLITNLGDADMTLALGLAEEVVQECLG